MDFSTIFNLIHQLLFFLFSFDFIYFILSLGSFCCSLLILIDFHKLKRKNFGLKLFIYANLSVFLNQTAIFLVFFFDSQSQFLLCFLQAFFIHFSELSAVIFSGILSYVYYDSLIKKNPSIFLNEQLFLLIGYGYPLLIALT